MWRPHANAYIWCFTMPPRPGLWYYFAFVVWLLFTNLPPHVWHCKIPIAQSCFGVIFAHALVSQTRTLRTFLTSALLTFPTINLVIAASLLCDPSLWDYPPGPRPYCSISINGKFLMRVFSTALFGIAISTFRITPLDHLINWFEMTRYVQLSNYAWLKALISDAIPPDFSQMKTNSLRLLSCRLNYLTIKQTSEIYTIYHFVYEIRAADDWLGASNPISFKLWKWCKRSKSVDTTKSQMP